MRKLLILVASALLAAGIGAGTVQAGASANPPSTPQCEADFDSLTAVNLWHSSKDWIWFVIDGDYYPGNYKSIDFRSGTTQTAAAFGNPMKVFPQGGSVTFQVVLDRTYPTANLVIDSDTVNCSAPGYNLQTTFSDGTATYKLVYDVKVV